MPWGAGGGVSLSIWNTQFFTFLGLEQGRLIEIHLITVARENLTEAWLKLEVPNRADIPHFIEVDTPAGLAVINIKLFSYEDVRMRVFSRNHLRVGIANSVNYDLKVIGNGFYGMKDLHGLKNGFGGSRKVMNGNTGSYIHNREEHGALIRNNNQLNDLAGGKMPSNVDDKSGVATIMVTRAVGNKVKEYSLDIMPWCPIKKSIGASLQKH